jgi:hypothetical protein
MYIITPNYTAPYLTLPFPSLFIVRSCFHLSSILLSRSTCYSQNSPFIPRSCNNILSTLTTSYSTHHTSFTYSLAGPKLKIRRHLVFDFRSTTAQTQIPWAIVTGHNFVSAPFCTLIFSFFGSGVLDLSYEFQGGTSAYTRRCGTRGRSVGLPLHFLPRPTHLHNIVGRPHIISVILF